MILRAWIAIGVTVAAVTAAAVVSSGAGDAVPLAANGRPLLPSAEHALIDNPDGPGRIVDSAYTEALRAAELYPPTDLQVERDPMAPAVAAAITAPEWLARAEPMMGELLGAFTLAHGRRIDWSRVVRVRAFYGTWGPEFELTHEHGDTLRVARSIDAEFGADWLYEEVRRIRPGEPRPTDAEIAAADFGPRWLVDSER